MLLAIRKRTPLQKSNNYIITKELFSFGNRNYKGFKIFCLNFKKVRRHY